MKGVLLRKGNTQQHTRAHEAAHRHANEGVIAGPPYGTGGGAMGHKPYLPSVLSYTCVAVCSNTAHKHTCVCIHTHTHSRKHQHRGWLHMHITSTNSWRGCGGQTAELGAASARPSKVQQQAAVRMPRRARRKRPCIGDALLPSKEVVSAYGSPHT